jgi:hypothetical protein
MVTATKRAIAAAVRAIAMTTKRAKARVARGMAGQLGWQATKRAMARVARALVTVTKRAIAKATTRAIAMATRLAGKQRQQQWQ